MMYSKNLKMCRNEKELTLKEMATIINIQKDTYGQYEREQYIIPTKHLNTISNYFNVSFDYLFDFTTAKQYNNSNINIDTNLVGKRLKEFRKENKLTQVKLATILNMGKGTLADYERGRYLIATPFLYTICKKYKISADYLLGKTDTPKYLK